MNINRNLVRLATTGAVATVAGIALAAPASAMILPGDPPYDAVYPSTDITPPPVPDPATDYGQIALGAVGGAVLAGAGVATVVLVRRRSTGPVHTA